eukprot:NODE_98_length_21025_cov_0.475055.p10 type:complete len:149 gc:universal NODE_98_length_21025_cov_0.475055:19093-19539(+)
MLYFLLVINRQGKTRLSKFYTPIENEEKYTLTQEVQKTVAPRDAKTQSNFVEFQWRPNHTIKLIYKRYAGLFFVIGVEKDANELSVLEMIHFFVETLDQFFGNVCELDLIFNFYKVYHVLDEVFLGGELQEMSRPLILARLSQLSKLQ